MERGSGDAPAGDIHPSVTIQELLQTQQWLDAQLHQHLVKSFADKIEVSTETDISKLTESISALQEQLISETIKLHVKELVFKRLQLGEEMELHLFEALDKVQISPMAAKHTPAIEKLSNQQKKLVQDVMKKQELYNSKRERLDELKKENYELMKQNRELFHRLRERREQKKQRAKEFSQDQDAQRLKKKLESIAAKVEVQRNTLQGLIFASGINWGQDPDMQALMISLGEPFET